MKVKERVLAYIKAQELTPIDLLAVTGGSAKATVDSTTQVTGSYPGSLDTTFDQVWDY